jgi:mitogen-activated protein kinase 1/3
MLGRKPLFPGQDYIDELVCITNILGTPSQREYDTIGSDQARNFLRTLEHKDSLPFTEIFPKANTVGIDLLNKLLKFNYRDRCGVEEAIQHVYLKDLHDPNDEPVAQAPFINKYNLKHLTKYQMKEIIFGQVVEIHPELMLNLEIIKQQHQAMYARQAENAASSAASQRQQQQQQQQPNCDITQSAATTS